MKTTNLFALLLVVLLSSCTAAYRTGQTPDDVYYSPARPEEEYVRVQREESRRYRYAEDYEDRYLRMKVRNRHQWNDLNDWYSYERWTLGSNSYFAPTLNPFVSWNYFYNPYYSYYNPYFAHWAIATAVTKPVTTGPRTFNLNSYQQTPVNIKSTRAQLSQHFPVNATAPANRSSKNNRGNSLREIFSNSGSTYTSPTSSSSVGNNSPSSSGGSASGGSAPVRRF